MKSRNPVQRLALVFTIALVAAGPARASSILTIPPSGDDTGQIDYENLQSALLEAMPGTTIQLEVGTYYLNYPVAVTNFRGRLEGAGQDLTIITTVGELPAFVTGAEDPQANPPSVDNPWPIVLSFVGGRFTLADMTFEINDYIPCRFDFYGVEYETLQSIVGVLGGDTGGRVRSAITRVTIRGAAGAFDGRNSIHGVMYAGIVGQDQATRGIPLSGMHHLCGSTFETINAGVTAFELAEHASLIISNNSITDVTFGHLMLDTSGWIDFSRNEVSAHPSTAGGDGYGVGAIQGITGVPTGLPPLPPVTLRVRDNVFHVENGVAGIFAADWQFAYLGTPPSFFLTARNNTIISDATVFGVYGYGLTCAMAVNNDIQGSVLDSGLMMELTADGWFILNDVQDVMAGNAPFVLAADTHDNLVITENAWHDVVDLTDDPSTPEYDGANTIISIVSWQHADGS